jgi:hypothetical protein
MPQTSRFITLSPQSADGSSKVGQVSFQFLKLLIQSLCFSARGLGLILQSLNLVFICDGNRRIDSFHEKKEIHLRDDERMPTIVHLFEFEHDSVALHDTPHA